ncbi:MAG: penicillin acylase family protein [Anaerolineae bacterium]
MHKRVRPVVFAIGIAAIAVALACAAGLSHWRRTLPMTTGRLRVSGLGGPVQIARDRLGIPAIAAQDEGDLLFAQGFVHAQDRFWQMELGRRMAWGTLAEVLGERALASDKLMRTIGLGRQAEVEWTLLSDDVRQGVAMYTRGVNAWMQSQAILPLEFQWLGYRPAPWRPQDTLAVARLLAWRQANGWQSELLQARLVAAVGPERAAQLGLRGSRAIPVPGEIEDLSVLDLALPVEEMDLVSSWDRAGAAADAWVVGPSKTANGGAIIATALSEGAAMPSAYYEVWLMGGRLDVRGASVPGIPGVVAGRNRFLAWAGVAGALDQQDLYLERVRARPEPQVAFDGAWLPLAVRVEDIHVRGWAEPYCLRIYASTRGPLLTEVIPSAGSVVSLRWAGCDRATGYIEALLAVNRASTWAEFRRALQSWATPALTFAYADQAGNTGSVVAGLAPLRKEGDGAFPAPGWLASYAWDGYQPIEGLPAQLNPIDDVMMLSAGSGVGAGIWGYEETWRRERAVALIREAGRVSGEQVMALATDVQGPDQPLLAGLLRQMPPDWRRQRTLPELCAWSGAYDAESCGAGVFEVYVWRLAHNTLDDDLGPALVDAYLNQCPNWRAFLQEVYAGGREGWVDDCRTLQQETPDEMQARSFDEAVHWLGRRFGDLPYEWNWGRAHNVTFRHILGTAWPANLLLNRGAMRLGGASTVLNRSQADYGASLRVAAIPGYRFVADLGDADVTWGCVSTGQSGHPLSGHYADQLEGWRRGQFHALASQSSAAWAAEKGQVLTLVPEDGDVAGVQ